MKKEEFIRQALYHPPTQITEELASLTHETHRVSDPYIFVVGCDGLYTPTGLSVARSIEKTSYLGAAEWEGFQQIQYWATGDHPSTTAIWFSPPFEGFYFDSKVIISQISEIDGVRVVFNRALIFDINAIDLLNLANTVSANMQITAPEQLRNTILFPTDQEFERWLRYLYAQYGLQNAENDVDLNLKTDQYARIEDVLADTVITAGQDSLYASVYKQLQDSGAIGPFRESCPTNLAPANKSAYQLVLEHSDTKTVLCKCPFCENQVQAVIKAGKIHCPKCKKSSDYSC